MSGNFALFKSPLGVHSLSAIEIGTLTDMLSTYTLMNSSVSKYFQKKMQTQLEGWGEEIPQHIPDEQLLRYSYSKLDGERFVDNSYILPGPANSLHRYTLPGLVRPVH